MKYLTTIPIRVVAIAVLASAATGCVSTGETINGNRLDPRIPAGSLSVNSIAIDRDYGRSSTQLSNTTRITRIESDGASGVYVTYGLDGSEHRIHFKAQDYNGVPGRGRMFFKSADRRHYFLWDYTGASFVGKPVFRYFNINGWVVADFAEPGDKTPKMVRRGPLVYGVRSNSLPTGIVNMVGEIYAVLEPSNFAEHGLRTTIRGDISLGIDFTKGVVAAKVDRVRAKSPKSSRFLRSENRLIIENASIANGRFQATLRSQKETDLVVALNGWFFGPKGNEVAGVMKGNETSSGSIVYGWFGGKQKK